MLLMELLHTLFCCADFACCWFRFEGLLILYCTAAQPSRSTVSCTTFYSKLYILVSKRCCTTSLLLYSNCSKYMPQLHTYKTDIAAYIAANIGTYEYVVLHSALHTLHMLICAHSKHTKTLAILICCTYRFFLF